MMKNLFAPFQFSIAVRLGSDWKIVGGLNSNGYKLLDSRKNVNWSISDSIVRFFLTRALSFEMIYGINGNFFHLQRGTCVSEARISG
jgi:hypothetical protein